jgi:hypothetical protein
MMYTADRNAGMPAGSAGSYQGDGRQHPAAGTKVSQATENILLNPRTARPSIRYYFMPSNGRPKFESDARGPQFSANAQVLLLELEARFRS